MYEYKAKFISAYDGDTIRLDIDLGFGIWMHNQPIRLFGIDTPELRVSNTKEKERAILARDKIREILETAETIIIQTYKDRKGKYGRWLAIIYADGTNVNEWMIENRYAKVYEE